MARLTRVGWRRARSRHAGKGDNDVAALGAVVEALWPGAEVRSGRDRAGSATMTFLALPSPAKPSILLPLRPSRATAAVLRAHRTPHSVRQRVRHATMVTLARLGAGHLVPRKVTVAVPFPHHAEPLESHLGSIVGDRVTLGVHLGPPRANRKPILQLISDYGKTVAFAKVGINDLTRDLVRGETAALRSLENVDFTSLIIPRILHSGGWGKNVLLVLAPVDTRNAPRSSPLLLQLAMVELSTSRGLAWEVLVRSGFWKQLRSRIENMSGSQATALLKGVVSMETHSPDLRVGLGAWHGDWTPWNMATRGDRVVLWDWERFGIGVPVGFDALHFELQSAIRRGRLTPTEAASGLIARAASLLAPFGVSRREARVVTATYLLEIGARYLHDRQEQAGSRLGDIGGWLLPELPALVSGAPAEHHR